MELPQVVSTARPKWLAIGAVAVLLGLVLRASWVTEDAYITLRTIDNFVNGYGLRWNVDERVQAYTHPLWMFLLSAGYVFTREAFTTTVVISVLCTAAAALGLVHFARSPGHAVAALVLLTLSKAFIEFSTSGLENPLSHLLIVIFAGLYAVRGAPLVQLAFTAALLALNRIDAIIVALPALVHVGWQEWRTLGPKPVLRALAVGFSPLIAWELFSIVYYGFPFPNTAYAKLNLGVPRIEVIRQGLTYWVNGLAWDPPLHVVMLFGVVAACINRRPRHLAVALGLLGYVAYVIGIGGDFMHGRFWTIPLCVAACLIAISELPLEDPLRASAVVLPFAFFFLHPNATEQFPIGGAAPSGIADERAFYRDDASLVLFSRNRPMPTHGWITLGRDLRARGERLFSFDNIGFLGYAAGPGVHIIDQLALSEPLLARLPMRYRSGWRVGHYSRHVPEGYRETVRHGKCAMTDTNLCEYYRKLREVIAGDVWSFSRFKTLIAMNLGMYDYLIDRERYRYPELRHVKLDAMLQTIPERSPWNAPGAHVMADDGIMIDLGRTSHAKYIDISFDGNDDYQVEFRSGGNRLARLESKSLDKGLMHSRRIDVPAEITKQGFDGLLVRPDGGDGMFSMGNIRLLDK
jgi:arabinofuranosyltransferase